MDKFKELMKRCKCGVYLSVNEHRDTYKTAEDHLADLEALAGGKEDYTAETRAKMIELDTIIDLQFYPDTPIGSYTILHYDLDAALDEAMQVFGETTASR